MKSERVLLRSRDGGERLVVVPDLLRELVVPLRDTSVRPAKLRDENEAFVIETRIYRRTRRLVVNEWGDLLPLFEEV